MRDRIQHVGEAAEDMRPDCLALVGRQRRGDHATLAGDGEVVRPELHHPLDQGRRRGDGERGAGRNLGLEIVAIRRPHDLALSLGALEPRCVDIGQDSVRAAERGQRGGQRQVRPDLGLQPAARIAADQPLVGGARHGAFEDVGRAQADVHGLARRAHGEGLGHEEGRRLEQRRGEAQDHVGVGKAMDLCAPTPVGLGLVALDALGQHVDELGRRTVGLRDDNGHAAVRLVAVRADHHVGVACGDPRGLARQRQRVVLGCTHAHADDAPLEAEVADGASALGDRERAVVFGVRVEHAGLAFLGDTNDRAA